MMGSEMRFSEQDQHERVGMVFFNFADFVGSVPVPGSDLAKILAWHAVEAVETNRVLAGGGEQLVKWRPIVSPIKIEADALSQFRLVNFAAPPFIDNVLIAGKESFNGQHYRTPVQLGMANQGSEVTL